MKKLSKEKKNQLLLVVVMTAVIATGIYTGLIRYQRTKLQHLEVEREKASRKLSQISEASRSSSKIEAELKAITTELDKREENMASDDLYASLINTIRKFKLDYEIEIKQFNSKGAASMNLIPRFPYEQFTVTIIGIGFYHDIGRFIADFENEFQSSRVLNLELLPDSAQDPANPEKLTFRMDIVSLVKPGHTTAPKKP
jgi:Tfp pilus assembly protein PilO